MPLVPLDRIKTWYHHDSFVYRAFSYLFKNSLWDRPIPKGASVCAYWWSAMFSLFIFRPLIVPGIRALRWSVRASRLTKAFGWFDARIHRLSFYTRSDTLGVNTAGFVASILLTSGCLFIIGTGLYLIYRPLAEAGMVGALPIGIAALTSLVILGVLYDDTSLTMLEARRIYWGIGAILIALTAAIYPAPFADLMHDLGAFVWSVLAAGAQGLIAGLMSLLAFWPLIVGGAIGTVIGAFVAIRFDWMPSPYQVYDDMRLRPARRMVAEWIIGRIGARLVTLSYGSPYNSFSQTRCLECFKKSVAFGRALSEIVDSTAWLRVKPDALPISISQERLDDILSKVWAEHVAGIEALRKRAKEASEAAAKALLKREARKLRLANSAFYRWVDRRKQSLRRAGGHVVTAGCFVWELIKAKKSHSCPYLVFADANQQPVPDAQPHV